MYERILKALTLPIEALWQRSLALPSWLWVRVRVDKEVITFPKGVSVYPLCNI